MLRSKATKAAIAVLITALTTVMTLTTTSASAATPPRTHARIAVHFDLAKGQTPENIALEPGGTAVVTLAAARQVARVDRNGVTRILATLPARPTAVSRHRFWVFH
ncbi:hypothetical protein [Amycolatopsis sp. EV170708-02-1]|uniref:hypothetical protein n=1 Tax=Amycolatopsis sp. EV170708-02-1 TaxID=2919322 RepID=UPI001F0BBF47|nr:hypothetical protein [Amycolatopsis sp. EV170708-02-1]UMP06872.1 hypothetical protein MJQ72_19590 [Amycolatopsis sp. EV170708-02-1]